ncbi:unnamed protein product [Paramecium pentaurelia]|uniref:Uncharacterized protein n=1 Tax=Paramecium pentaurelia TaxID=43138 RepID=A0A8S1W3K7_9CILI|nr:unnamed protein product [Paramecium pentaurelia]
MQQNPLELKINTFNLTSSPEKFICISTQCQEKRDQSFGCYEQIMVVMNRLIKKHNQIDQLHFDKIIEIKTFLSQIQQKQQKKIELLEIVIQIRNSESDLKQIIETIQDQKSVSKNQTNQQWLISEILENRSVQEFQNFTLLYENSFSKPFTNYSYEQILLKVFQDKKDQIVCIGAKLNLNLKLIGCDLASEVFSLTQNAYSARKNKNGEIYWYWFSSKSFGFSPNRNIALNNIDEEDPFCELRFSYCTTKNLEDRRIGSLKAYKNTKEYNLVIYMLKENN